MIWVPISVKFGKRAVLISSMALLFATQCWCAKASTFNSLLAARCVSGFAAAAGEVSFCNLNFFLYLILMLMRVSFPGLCLICSLFTSMVL